MTSSPGRRRFLVASALLIFAAYAGRSLFLHHRRQAAQSGRQGASGAAAPGPTEETADRLYLRNIAYTSYKGDTRLFSFQADELVHRKRKIGPLTLNPVKEIEATRVRIEMVSRGEEEDRTRPAEPAEARDGLDLPVATILEKTLAARDLGFVSRVVLKPVEIAVNRGGRTLLRVAAGSASVGLSEPAALRFEDGFTLEDCCGGHLSARQAEWSAAGRRLHVDGAYSWSDSQDSRTGEGAVFRVDRDGRLTEEITRR